MNIEDLNQIKKYFIEYGKDEQLGSKFFHKENDNFKIIITPENELYQLNTDHEPWGVELDTIDNLKIRFKSFTGENLEDITNTCCGDTDQMCNLPVSVVKDLVKTYWWSSSELVISQGIPKRIQIMLDEVKRVTGEEFDWWENGTW